MSYFSELSLLVTGGYSWSLVCTFRHNPQKTEINRKGYYPPFHLENPSLDSTCIPKAFFWNYDMNPEAHSNR